MNAHLSLVSEKDQGFDQASAQGRVQHSIVRVQELDELRRKVSSVLWVAGRDLHGSATVERRHAEVCLTAGV